MAEKKTKTAPVKKAAEKKEKETVRTGKVFGGSLNIRPEPGVDNIPTGQLNDGTEIVILEDLGEWFRIDKGYVMSKWVK